MLILYTKTTNELRKVNKRHYITMNSYRLRIVRKWLRHCVRQLFTLHGGDAVTGRMNVFVFNYSLKS